MEHKLITGGEQYLPFARSRIKAMRATGLMFASQQYEIDGCSIKVRIEGDHEFITLSGGTEILSGVIRGGHIIELPAPPGSGAGTVKTMRSYKPTQNAWDTVLHKDPAKSPSTFNDEKKLKNADEQYAELAASQFSGLMAKVVQVVMGQGKPVKYKFKWLTCHGVTKAADDKFWLVEISKANGVIAMPLHLAVKGEFTNDIRDAVKECGAVFGGVPSGRSFPKPADIASMITSGSIIRLASADYMAAYFENHAFHDDLGWSFNADGTEAHNTCYSGEPWLQTPVTSFHYKLDITIEAMNPNRAANAPRAAGSAVLSVVESGRLVIHPYYAPTIPFLFAGGVVPAELQITDPDYSGSDAPIFVCHIDGVLEVVRVAVVPQGTPIHSSSGDLTTHRNYTLTHEFTPGGRRVYAPRATTGSDDYAEVTEITTVESTEVTVTYSYAGHNSHYEEGQVGGVLRRGETYIRNGRGVILWTGTIRDSYAFTSALPAAVTTFGYSYQIGNPDPATGGSIDVNNWAATDYPGPPGAPTGYYYFERLQGTVTHITTGVDSEGFGYTLTREDINLVGASIILGHGLKIVEMDCYLPDGTALNIPDIAPYTTDGIGWEVINATIRTNCFGPNPQTTFATYLKSLNQGSLLAGVADSTPDLINFIGYI